MQNGERGRKNWTVLWVKKAEMSLKELSFVVKDAVFLTTISLAEKLVMGPCRRYMFHAKAVLNEQLWMTIVTEPQKKRRDNI